MSDDEPLSLNEVIEALVTAIRCLDLRRYGDARAVLLELNFALEQDLAAELLEAAEDAGEPYPLH